MGENNDLTIGEQDAVVNIGNARRMLEDLKNLILQHDGKDNFLEAAVLGVINGAHGFLDGAVSNLTGKE